MTVEGTRACTWEYKVHTISTAVIWASEWLVRGGEKAEVYVEFQYILVCEGRSCELCADGPI